jgi:hypothetical protein
MYKHRIMMLEKKDVILDKEATESSIRSDNNNGSSSSLSLLSLSNKTLSRYGNRMP